MEFQLRNILVNIWYKKNFVSLIIMVYNPSLLEIYQHSISTSRSHFSYSVSLSSVHHLFSTTNYHSYPCTHKVP